MNNVVTFEQAGLLETMARRYHLAADIFERTVAAVAMPQKNGQPDCSREELVSCLMIAHEHDLNPITKEIFFMRSRSGVIQPIVSVDGWVKKLNQHPQFDGLEFDDHIDNGQIVAITCRVYRKDRARPVSVTEYMVECKGQSAAWKQTPARMLRHRVLTQAARYAIGFAGVMDYDEYDQWQHTQKRNPEPAWIEARPPEPEPAPEFPDIEASTDAGEVIDADTGEIIEAPSVTKAAAVAANPVVRSDPDAGLTPLMRSLEKCPNTTRINDCWKAYIEERPWLATNPKAITAKADAIARVKALASNGGGSHASA